VSVQRSPDLVAPVLPALKAYQLTLGKPPAPPGVDLAAANRGQAVFTGAGRCASCHVGTTYTDANVRLHSPAETGTDPTWASRSATKLYRTTPLRGLAQHPPYFHDGSAATLTDVVAHYNTVLGLHLSARQESDLIEYLKTL
jgi:mono/diheme cytochrome c family protein